MHLYKYLSPQRINVLENCLVRFSTAADLNDPFELKPYIKTLAPQQELLSILHNAIPTVFEEEYRKLPAEMRALISKDQLLSMLPDAMPNFDDQFLETTQGVVPAIQNGLHHSLEQHIGILCLSETPLSLLMWAHYADSHKGFVIEFDTSSAFFNQRRSEEDEFRHLRKVVYQPTRPALTMNEMSACDTLLTKGAEWAYEEEWRMLANVADSDKSLYEGTSIIHLFSFPPSAITRIIIGSRADQSLTSRIAALIQSDPSMNHIQLSRAEISQTEYKIIIRNHAA